MRIKFKEMLEMSVEGMQEGGKYRSDSGDTVVIQWSNRILGPKASFKNLDFKAILSNNNNC